MYCIAIIRVDGIPNWRSSCVLSIDLRTLGTVNLLGFDGIVADTVLRQPKRLALLLYLALARPYGFQRRDTLLALFWPELDTQRARAALRKSLYVLRQELGSDALLSRGDEEIGLNRDCISCDVWRFEASLENGELGAALELYRGDLLEGFHPGDVSPDFEHWLEVEQVRLKQSAAAAGWALSESAEAAGNLEAAARWGRRAVSIMRPNEQMLRRLLTLLDRAGDRSGALDKYARFAAWLESEHGAAPSPETEALVLEIRAREESSIEYVTAGGDPRVEELPALTAAAPARRLERWHAPLILVGFFIAIALVPTIIAIRGDPIPELEPNRLAIAPFATFDPTLEVWGEGVVDYLSRSLDGSGALRTLSPTTAVRTWSGRADAASAIALGEATGSGLVVFGSLMGVGGDSVRVSATVFDVINDNTLGDIEIRGTADRMDQLVDSLTVEVLRELGPTGQVGASAHTSIGSRSMPALKAFLQGEQALRRTAWDTARTLYAEAIAHDSMFALAHLRFGTSELFIKLEEPDGWVDIYRAGQLNTGGLSEHDSLIVAATSGIATVILGRAPEGQSDEVAVRAYQAALAATAAYPLDAEVWFVLGAVREALYVSIGTTPAQMAKAYGRAIELDSTFAPAYRQALRYALDEGDIETGRSHVRKLLSLNPPEDQRAYALVIDRMLDPSATEDSRSRLLDSVPPRALWLGWVRLWLLTDSAEAAIRVSRVAEAREHDRRYWFTADFVERRNLAASLAYRGHLREAFEFAGTDDSSWFQALLGELSMLGAVPEDVADSTFSAWLATDPFIHRGTKYTQLWWAERRDTTSLKRLLELYGEGDGSMTPAALALARADTAEAIRQFENWFPTEDDSVRVGDGRWDFDQWGTIVWARLLVAEDRPEEALAVLQGNLAQDWPIPSRVVWRLERARLEEELGDLDAALEDYRYVAAAWQHADASLQSLAQEAREGALRLGG